jgi:iron complex outermembrane recepter protein
VLDRTALALLFALPLTLPSAATAQNVAPVSIEAGSLPYALQDLQRQTGIELLFDPSLVRGLQSPAVHGELSTEAALRQLLGETGLTVRRAQSGAWVVERPNAPPMEQQDAEAPEIIVVGRRTQNADIRRFENDVQPYVVVTQQELRNAHRDNVDQYFASRITPNTTVVPPYLDDSGNTWSEIDLRGIGAENTLVLVDGRRMPFFPSTVDITQGDVNSIPMHSIERIEVLTGAASGIHGYGALGGVVNIVLDRDDRGFEAFLTEGISSRGDAHRRLVEARYGATSQDGRTDFTAFAAHSDADNLQVGDRDFLEHDRRRTQEIAPDFYSFFGDRYGNSLTIESLFGTNLQLKPEFGGGTLPSSFTFLPTGFSGNPADFAASVMQNAGQTDFTLAEEDADTDLVPRMRSDALLMNLRHRFGSGLEIYADAVVLRSSGEFDDWRSTTGGTAFISPDSPVNPFTDFISVHFPIEGTHLRVDKTVENTRYTVGLLSDLPLGWRGTAEASEGAFYYDAFISSTFSLNSFLILFGDPSDAETNPFGNWEAFQAFFNTDPSRLTIALETQSQLSNQSLRLAGPVFRTAAGPATLTLLAEHRVDEIPAYTLYSSNYFGGGGPPSENESTTPSSTNDTISFHAELRAPLFGDAAPSPFLRGLEVQLAVRHDTLETEFQRYIGSDNPERLEVTFPGANYTLGLKLSPTPWLMLRGSYATGEQTPLLDNLREREPEITTRPTTLDPRRGNTGLDTPFLFRTGGNPDLDAPSATSLFVGAVVTPFREDGPRFSIDYSRVRRTGDIIEIFTDEFLQNEELWPDRIVRGPLTDADVALGYTGGPVLELDARSMNFGSLESESIDLRVDWPLYVWGGRLRFYGDATYHMRNFHRVLLSQDFDHAGRFQGPLKWRANAGVEWSTADLTLGANVQYFGEYSIMFAGETAPTLETMMQGSDHIEAQTYLDVYAGWRLPNLGIDGLRDVTLELGVNNVLDARPPRETTFGAWITPSYSRYGDPRQRRFELVLSSRF